MTCRNWESGVVIPILVDDSAGSEHEYANYVSAPTEARFADSADSTSLVQARSPEIGKASQLDRAKEFKIRSLQETFSSTIPVPVKDDRRLIDKGLEPWFFRD